MHKTGRFFQNTNKIGMSSLQEKNSRKIEIFGIAQNLGKCAIFGAKLDTPMPTDFQKSCGFGCPKNGKFRKYC